MKWRIIEIKLTLTLIVFLGVTQQSAAQNGLASVLKKYTWKPTVKHRESVTPDNTTYCFTVDSTRMAGELKKIRPVSSPPKSNWKIIVVNNVQKLILDCNSQTSAQTWSFNDEISSEADLHFYRNNGVVRLSLHGLKNKCN